MPRLQIGFTRGRVYFPIRNAAPVEVGGAFEPRIPSPDIEPAALLPAPPVAPAALLRTPPVPPAGAPVCADEAVPMRAKQVTKPIAEIFMVSLR